MLLTTEGIVIRATDYGETNRIVTLLTPEHGKMAVMARGAKKPQSRLRAVTQLFVCGTFSLFRGRSGMGILRQGELVTGFRTIQEDLAKTAYATYACELVDRLLDDGISSPAIYTLLHYYLAYLAEGKDPDILTSLLETRMCETAGVRPMFAECPECGNAPRIPRFFSLPQGGVV
jgi:DNA repair protein RecO (recombination protein O)